MLPSPDLRWTVDPVTAATEILQSAGIPSARLEAGLLLGHLLGLSRAQIVARLFEPLTPEQISRYQDLIAHRAARVPLAYLRGYQEFYGITFEVSSAVLIPRPETELLVEFGIQQVRVVAFDHRHTPVLADVGTGSGCIAVAVAANVPESHVLALDLSSAALSVARRNVAAAGVNDRVRLVRSNLLSAVAPRSLDIVLSNPPYIPSVEIESLQPEVRDYEPRTALDGGATGLEIHRELMKQARLALRPGGWIAIEVAMGQAAYVAGILAENGFNSIGIQRDLAGIERMVFSRAPE
jgi:release factor glutamine methyltransferase